MSIISMPLCGHQSRRVVLACKSIGKLGIIGRCSNIWWVRIFGGKGQEGVVGAGLYPVLSCPPPWNITILRGVSGAVQQAVVILRTDDDDDQDTGDFHCTMLGCGWSIQNASRETVNEHAQDCHYGLRYVIRRAPTGRSKRPQSQIDCERRYQQRKVG